MKNERIAAYVVGDENIGIGALAALSSFKKYNKEIELFLFTYIEKLDNNLIKEFNNVGVNLCDISQYIEKVEVFGEFSSGELHWPKETFINYYVPYIIGEKYDYLIKLDYDLLTVAKMSIDEIIPKNKQVLSSIYNPFNLHSMIYKDYDYYQKKYYIDVETQKKIGLNTGFLIINVKKYLDEDIFNGMKELFLEIREDSEERCKRIYADQGLLTMYIGFNSIPTKKIADKYNLTAIILREYDQNDLVNIHFTGSIKPWKNLEIDEEFLRSFGLPFYVLVPKWRDYMLENHKDIYDELNISDSNDLVDIVLSYTKSQSQLKRDLNKIKSNNTSRMFLIKQIVKITLKQFGLRKEAK